MFLGSWTLNNTRLLLLSGIGEPYDPGTGKGVVGRNLTHQVSFTPAQAFFDKPLNRFMGAAPAGMRMSDFDGDVFDHSNLPFMRGGTFAGIGTGFQPIVGFGAVPSFGEGALGQRSGRRRPSTGTTASAWSALPASTSPTKTTTWTSTRPTRITWAIR